MSSEHAPAQPPPKKRKTTQPPPAGPRQPKAKKAQPTAEQRGALEAWQESLPCWTENFELGDLQGIRGSLQQHGLAVVRGLLQPAEIQSLLDLAYSDLQKLGTGIRADDITTFVNKNWPGIASVGIVKDGRSGLHTGRLAWELRRYALERFFVAFLGAEDLLVSFDTLGLFRNYWLARDKAARGELPREEAEKMVTKGLWFHVDLVPTDKTGEAYLRDHLQSFVNLLPADASTGGLVCVPGSHTLGLHEDLLRSFGYAGTKKNYLPLGPLPALRTWLQGRGLEAYRVAAPAGALVLWHSAAIHCNAPALRGARPRDPWLVNSPLLRVVGYVHVVPAANFTAAEKERLAAQRRAWVDNGALTTHWIEPARARTEVLAYPRSRFFLPLAWAGLTPAQVRADYGRWL
eukprot:g68936.t1